MYNHAYALIGLGIGAQSVWINNKGIKLCNKSYLRSVKIAK